MTAYYNENDPYAAQWLRNLIAAGHIAAGDVDERSIVDVRGDDLCGYDQCHFFAGIGGWSYALRIAGWSDDKPVWTGSCPCQPLSSAGQQRGHADERHLWPAFHSLIAECSPPVVFGEQVASKDGREWLAGVRADLEGLGYAVRAADLCAAGVGAPHIRQRLWWVADHDDAGRSEQWLEPATDGDAPSGYDADGSGEAGRVADATSNRRSQWHSLAGSGDEGRDPSKPHQQPYHSGISGGLGHADGAGSQGRDEPRYGSSELSPWEASWISCSDGKARRAQPGIFPLAHGVSNRVGRLRAYGNAIVPQVAAEFIKATLQ